MKPQMNILQRRAEENASVTRKTTGKFGGIETLKQGTPLDHAIKQGNETKRTAERQIVGISKGLTLNMENFESLRVDCWLTDVVKDFETVDQAFQRVGAIIDEQLDIQTQEYRAE